MSLWGTSTSDRSKPKFLKAGGRFSPDNCYATDRGWMYRNTNGKEELLIAISGLATSLGAAQITQVYFDKASYSATDIADITVAFSEAVTKVSGTPTLSITTVSGLAGSPLTFTYASGSTTNEFHFQLDLSTVSGLAGETLAIAGQTIGVATFSDTAGGSDVVDLAFASGDLFGAGGAATYVSPTVSGATIIAAGFGAASYAHTETATVKVKWNQIVAVTGVPTVSINEATVSAANAHYLSGSGTDTLTFSLDMSAGSWGVSGKSIQILAQTIGVSGATITSGGVAADLTIASGDRKDSALTGAYADIVLS